MSDERLVTWVQAEQHILWRELKDAIDSAINGSWSMRAADTARRIVEAARMVGPTSHDEVLWPLLAGGVYDAVLTAGDIRWDLLDEAEWQRLDALMGKYGTRASHRVRYATTVAEILSDRERAWISGGDE